MVKKRVVKKRSITAGKKSPIQIKNDLALFEKGVGRLKELESELDSLDTRGFYNDEQKIRIKLKSVSDIPIIEKEIKNLKLKINGKYKPRRRKKSKVAEQLENLNKKFESMEKCSARKKSIVDSGVGIIVDTDFNSFLDDIKQKLSHRVTNKEKEINDILKNDLQKRELNFKEKYENLIKEFNTKKSKMVEDSDKKYELKLKSSLQKEVSEKFNKKLKEKLDFEKVALGKKYKTLLKLHAMEHLKKKESILKEKLDNEINLLEQQFKKKQEEIELKEQKQSNLAKKEISMEKEEINKKYNAKISMLNAKMKRLEEQSKKLKLHEQKQNDLAKKEISMEKKKIGIEFDSERLVKNRLKGMKMGAVAPFGALFKVPTFVNKSLLNKKKIILNSGRHDQSIVIKGTDFEKIVTDLIKGSFAKPRKKRG